MGCPSAPRPLEKVFPHFRFSSIDKEEDWVHSGGVPGAVLAVTSKFFAQLVFFGEVLVQGVLPYTRQVRLLQAMSPTNCETRKLSFINVEVPES